MSEDEKQDGKRSSPFQDWLKHAFAIDKYDESSLEEDEKELLRALAKRIADKKMTAAAILWIESHRHLNYMSSQLLVAAQPVLDVASPVVNPLLQKFGMYIPLNDLPKLQRALEKRYSVEYFLLQLEAEAAGDYNTATADPDEEGNGG